MSLLLCFFPKYVTPELYLLIISHKYLNRTSAFLLQPERHDIRRPPLCGTKFSLLYSKRWYQKETSLSLTVRITWHLMPPFSLIFIQNCTSPNSSLSELGKNLILIYSHPYRGPKLFATLIGDFSMVFLSCRIYL